MNKLLITGCLLATAFAAVAMPTKKELAAAQKLVEDVIAPDVKALNAGRKTVKDVADVQMKLAADAQSEAEKYLLLQSAFKLYSRGEEFDSAAKALTAITRDIKDVPPELITELVDKEFNRDMGLKAPKEIEAAERAAQRQRIVAFQKERQDARKDQWQATVDGYTWSYRVNNGEAEIVSPTGKLGECAVSPKPTGDVTVPATLGGAKVTSIGNSAFAYCREITSVAIPPSVTNISRWAFYQCWRLNSVVIPEGVISIGALAFEDCWHGLTSVSIPSTVTKIGWCAFAGNSGKLTAFDVSPTNPKYASVNGLLCSKDGKIVIAGVNGDVKIPEGVTSIGDGAFRKYSGLISVEIPASVKSVGTEVFSNCRGLESVTMRGEKPDSGDKVFDKCDKLKSIHVPANAKSWAGMKEWQGIPLVFDGELVGRVEQTQTETEKAQRDAGRAEQRRQLLAIQDELKRVRGMKDSSPAVRKAVESILKGMIKVPGRDYWLSATELTQEQWEPIMEFNLSERKGAKLPVGCVSRDDCDVFLEKLNQTKEVLSSGFEFRLPELEEWKYAAWAGSAGNGSWIKPGVGGDILDMAWVRENSSNEMHAVATKAANAFGFYDMLGNVWEWLAGDAPGGKGALKGCAFSQAADKCTWNQNLYLSKVQRVPLCGLRLAAHKKDFLWQPLSGGLRRPGSASNRQQDGSLRARRLQRQQKTQAAAQRQVTVDGYTWSYRVNNGEAEIVAENSGKFACAVSPTPAGDITIPAALDGVKVTSIGKQAFKECNGLTSVTIPEGVNTIEWEAFCLCRNLASVTIPSTVTDIKVSAFYQCERLETVTLPQDLKNLWGNCFMVCRKLAPVTIPASVTNVGGATFAYCPEIKEHNLGAENKSFISVDGVLYTKDRKELVACPSGKTSVNILESVTNILSGSITGCEALKSLAIPPNVSAIGSWALSGSGVTSITLPQGLSRIEDCLFWGCHDLIDVTIPDSVTSIGGNAFRWCGKLTSVTIPKGVKSIGGEAFYDCGGLTSITMCGERPEAPNNVFKGCRNLKSIHVPANAKSWAGMKEWQGIPLVFDGK